MKIPLDVRQGSTFSFVVRWETAPVVYRPITGIAADAPARLTVPDHGLTNGWRAAVVSVLGMTEINAGSTPPRDNHYHLVTVLTASTVELNGVNAALYSPYLSGGYLQYNSPADLAGFTARMKVKNKVGGTLLLELTTENTRITLDNVEKTVALSLTAVDTEALTFTRGVYDLEMVSPAGVVTPIAEGPFRVSREITTTT